MEEHMNTLAKATTVALAAFGLVGTAITPALATDGETKTVGITFSDLDLATPQGQKILDERIERAVREACSASSMTTGTRIQSSEHRACVAQGRAQARQQIAKIAQNPQRGG
jgi:UrcA family protein